jgi:TonB family protein
MPTLVRCAAVLFLSACLFAQEAAKPAEAAPASVAAQTALPPDSTGLMLKEAKRPDYPLYALDNKMQGETVLRLFVNEQGEVYNTEVIRGDEIFAKAAQKAAMKFRFEPFIRNGKRMKVSTKFPFDFYIEGNVSDVRMQTAAPSSTSSPDAAGQPRRVQVAPGISTGLLIHRVQPAYPPEAKAYHIQGAVILQAVIGKDGRIENLEAISGPQELRQAAMGAVQQWIYEPYMLNGEPVAVYTQVTVNFKLNRW